MVALGTNADRRVCLSRRLASVLVVKVTCGGVSSEEAQGKSDDARVTTYVFQVKDLPTSKEWMEQACKATGRLVLKVRRVVRRERCASAVCDSSGGLALRSSRSGRWRFLVSVPS